MRLTAKSARVLRFLFQARTPEELTRALHKSTTGSQWSQMTHLAKYGRMGATARMLSLFASAGFASKRDGTWQITGAGRKALDDFERQEGL